MLGNTFWNLLSWLVLIQCTGCHSSGCGGNTRTWSVRFLNDGNFVCDGAFVDARWILTAARCFINLRNMENLAVAVSPEGFPVQEKLFRIRRIEIHPHYTESNTELDIALIELSQDGVFLEYTGSLCIHTFEKILTKNCYRIQNLLKTKVDLLDSSSCISKHGYDVICVNTAGTRAGGCQDTEGLVLACESEDGRYFARGILIANSDCTVGTIYQRIDNVSTWIWNTVHNAVKRTLMGARSFTSAHDPCTTKTGSVLNGTSGNFTSPGYDGETKYALDLDCSWTITVPENHKVLLEFDTFDVEQFGGSCSADFVKAYSGAKKDEDQLIAKLCSIYVPAKLLSESNVMLVRFYSDFYGPALGFVARFSAVSKDILVSGCGGPRIIKEEQAISSLSFPLDFETRPGERCIWDIEAPEGKRILFSFINLPMNLALENELRISDVRSSDIIWYLPFNFDNSPRSKKVISRTNEAIVEVKVWNYGKETSDGFYANLHFINENETDSYTDATNLDLEVYDGYCGYQKILPKTLTGRIISGNASVPNSWPWQVNLRNAERPDTKILCGGTVISNSWVVTAGHCTNHPALYVFAGSHLFYRTNYKMQISKVKQKIVHPKYKELSSWDNDIALLKLERAFTFTDFVRPACIPSTDVEFPNGTICFASGWGLTKEKGAHGSHTLREATIPLISREKCAEIYYTEFTVNMLCAGYLEGGIDACQGDSGGPLVCRKPGQLSWVLTGVTSWGWGCGRENYPGVYTRVNRYGSWFKEVTESEAKPNYNNSGVIPTFAPTTPAPTTEAPTTVPTTPPEPPCVTGTVIEGGTGLISLQTYNSYYQALNCSWIIKAPHTAALMRMRFKYFDLTSSNDTSCDDVYVIITVNDVYNNISRTEKYCKDMTPPEESVYSMEIVLKVMEFTSTNTGFDLHYQERKDPCGGDMYILDDISSGRIFSPNYPNTYSEIKRCTWLLASEHKQIELITTYLALPYKDDGTCIDNLTIRTTEQVYGPYCHVSQVEYINTIGNVTIVLESSTLVAPEKSGFLITFSQNIAIDIFQGSDCFSLYFVDKNGNITGTKLVSNEEERICRWNIVGTMGLPIKITVTPWKNITNVDCNEYYIIVSYGDSGPKVCLDQPKIRTFIADEEEVTIEFFGPFGQEKIGFDADFHFIQGNEAAITRQSSLHLITSLLIVCVFT